MRFESLPRSRWLLNDDIVAEAGNPGRIVELDAEMYDDPWDAMEYGSRHRGENTAGYLLNDAATGELLGALVYTREEDAIAIERVVAVAENRSEVLDELLRMVLANNVGCRLFVMSIEEHDSGYSFVKESLERVGFNKQDKVYVYSGQ